MRPLVQHFASGSERPIAEVRAALAAVFELTEEDLTERLPSGTAKTFDNRVGWATTYLTRCGLLQRVRRSVYQITPRGQQMLAEHPERIDLGVLSQFPEFDEFRAATGRRRRTNPPAVPLTESTSTPEERIEAADLELRNALAAEIRERITAMSAAAFEDLVLDVLHEMGYGDEGEGARLRIGGSGDAGIDGVIPVGRPEVQAFVGALQGARAAKGVMFTASQFSSDARAYVAAVSPGVVLVDGQRLAELMIDHNVGVSERENYSVKRIDTDYFGDNA
jgi:restriction system protein